MFTYAELISLQSAMTDKIARSKRILNEATHIDTIEGMREILEGCLNDDIRTLKKNRTTYCRILTMKTIYIALREGQKWTFAFRSNNYDRANQALKKLQAKYKNLKFTLISGSKIVDCKSAVDVLRLT